MPREDLILTIEEVRAQQRRPGHPSTSARAAESSTAPSQAAKADLFTQCLPQLQGTSRHGGDPPSDYSVPRGFGQSKTWEVLQDNTPAGRARRGSRGQAGATPEPAGTAASRQQLG